MKVLKVVFTDSGLGGISIMADFVQRVEKAGIVVDSIFFNAQYSRDLGYKKMKPEEQTAVFNSVLQSIEENYHPDIIAIACNTLSVVYKRTDFQKTTSIKVWDIIETGKKLIAGSKHKNLLQIAMPTTINSKIYTIPNKNNIGIASHTQLPDAIENNYQEDIDTYLESIFKTARTQLKQAKTDLFLGCTHFPIIKEQFLQKAKKYRIEIQELLNPNTAFSQLVFDSIQKENKLKPKQTNKVQVISRMPFQKKEVQNISRLIEEKSPKTAEALRKYQLDPKLF